MKLRNAVLAFYQLQGRPSDCSFVSRLDSRILILVTLVYLVFLLSVPLENLKTIILFASYPIIVSPLINQKYSSIFRQSLYVLPFLVMIGIFNPLYDRRDAFPIGEYMVSMGWVTFISILVRGLLAMQALLLLVRAAGFLELCRGLGKLGMPKVLVVQLMFIYRFLIVLLEESLNMRRSVISRGYGRKTLPIKLWGRIVGSLMLRTLTRSKKIHMAMQSRGFCGY